MFKKLTTFVLIYLVGNLLIYPAQAQTAGGEEYVVQAGDWLTKIADKYYGNPQDYTLIVEGTNERATNDEEFEAITNPDLIEVGQKVWVPIKEEEGLLNIGDLSFRENSLDNLGVDMVVPAVWPKVEENGVLQNVWRAGPFSFVSFGSTPGNDAKIGVARLLGVTSADLESEVLGGEFSEIEIEERTWSIYTLDDGGTASVAAATVEDKVIYQINLFAVSPQKDLILETILDNFEITDPTAAQQQIEIVVPEASAELTNPFEIRGTTRQYPFRGSLVYRVLDAEGNQVGRGPFEVVGRVGGEATFTVAGTYDVPTAGPGTVEVAEISASDGTLIAIDSVAVNLAADPEGYDVTIDDPGPFASVSSPVQIRGKANDRPSGGTINYRIVDADGEEVSRGFLQASGVAGEVNLYDGFAPFDVSQEGPGRIEVFDTVDETTLTIATVNIWLTTSP